LRQAQPAANADILRVHDPDYLERFLKGQLDRRQMRRIGFPWSEALVQRTLHSVGATIQASQAALADGMAASLSGGTHHAFRDRGEGFCILNDTMIAARKLQYDGLIERIAIIDCDVHQGNGTASLSANDNTIFTFSIHGKNNFPFRKQKSDLDIELDDGTGDKTYLEALTTGLEQVRRQFEAQFVFYLAGADPYRKDHFGKLALTKAGLAERDRLVLQWCRRTRLPVAITMAGGYTKDIADTVDIQYETVRTALSMT
jgi:acetoin utilization deacetylase AcuC-like enzyme